MYELILSRSDGVKFSIGKNIKNFYSERLKSMDGRVYRTIIDDKIFITFLKGEEFIIYPRFFSAFSRSSIFFLSDDSASSKYSFCFDFDNEVSMEEEFLIFLGMYSTFGVTKISKIMTKTDIRIFSFFISISKINRFKIEMKNSDKILFVIGKERHIIIEYDSSRSGEISIFYEGKIAQKSKVLDVDAFISLILRFEKESISSSDGGKYFSFIKKIILSR